MSYSSFARVSSILSPADVSHLAGLFARICANCEEPESSEKASQCAGTLIRSYQRGIKDEEMLFEIGRAVIRS